MRRSSGIAKKKAKPAKTALIMLLFIGGIALALRPPTIKWVKDQFHKQELAHRGSIREQNRRNWCLDVYDTNRISQSDYTYCEDVWKTDMQE